MEKAVVNVRWRLCAVSKSVHVRRQWSESQEREKIVREVQVPKQSWFLNLPTDGRTRCEVVKSLMKMGMMVTQNQSIDADTAELIIEEFGHKIVRVSDADVEDVINEVEDAEKILNHVRL